MNSRTPLKALALAVPFLLLGCADFSRGPGPVPPDTFVADTGGGGDSGGDTGGGCTPGAYATAIYPLLQLSCDTCHSSSGQAASSGLVFTGSPADDHSELVGLVDTANPTNSVLVKKSSGATSHGGGAIFAADGPEEQQIICWIAAGAPQ